MITDDPAVARACAPIYAAMPYLADSLPTERCDLEAEVLLERGVIAAVQSGLCSAGHEVVVLQVGGAATAAPRGVGLCTRRVSSCYEGRACGRARCARLWQRQPCIAMSPPVNDAPAPVARTPPAQGVEACSCRCAPVVSIKVAPGRAEQYVSHKGSTWYEPTLSLRSTAIALEVGWGAWG